MDLYDFTERIGKDTVFNYIAIMVGCFFVFRNRIIGLNIFLSIFIGWLIIKYIDDSDQKKNLSEHVQQRTKKEIITPKLEEDLLDKEDLVDFIYSIQDIYHFNPQSFESMIDSMNSFMKLHKLIMIDNSRSDRYWNILDDLKRKSINSLHELIYSLDDDKYILDKFNRAHKRLETLMTNYMNEIYDRCMEKLITKGYDVNTKILNIGPKPYNTYQNFLNNKFTDNNIYM